MKKVHVITLLIGAVLLLVLAGCGQEQAVVEEEVAEALSPDSFTISMEPAGHWHVFSPKTLLFNVVDTASGEGVAGLDLIIQIAQAESDSVRERSVSGGDVTDEGDGLYALEYTPSSIGSYGIVANFVEDGQHFASAPVAVEIAKAGEEGLKATVDGTDYVYQIRYHFEPGHIHANDGEPVSMVFELMRGLETGGDINWEQPWMNRFDHVSAADDAVVEITAADGSVSDSAAASYQGRGIWEAQRVFSVDEVGEGMDYTINISFVDAANGAQVANGEPFDLHAVPGH